MELWQRRKLHNKLLQRAPEIQQKMKLLFWAFLRSDRYYAQFTWILITRPKKELEKRATRGIEQTTKTFTERQKNDVWKSNYIILCLKILIA